MNRRSFLKRTGAATLAVVAAPLYVPAERLDFGVPTRPETSMPGIRWRQVREQYTESTGVLEV